MAFLIDCKLEGYEVRGIQTGTSKKGNVYKSIRCESKEGNTCEISVTNQDLFGHVDQLSKGDIVTLDVRAVSGRERSYITLMSAPVVSGNAYYSGADY